MTTDNIYTTLTASQKKALVNNTWQKLGPVFTGSGDWAGYNVAEPSVIYESGIYKMWYRGDGGIGYATSTNGLTWTQYASNPLTMPSTYAQPYVFKNGSTYYMYVTDQTHTGSTFSVLTSTDGITWALLAENLLSQTTADNSFGNLCVWIEGSTWYMIYESKTVSSAWYLSLATSPDGVTWTRYASNPVKVTAVSSEEGTSIIGCASGPHVLKIDGVYYLWFQAANHPIIDGGGNLPTDICMATSTDLITWTDATNSPVLSRTLTAEGLNAPFGQVADPTICYDGTDFWMFYEAGPDQDFDAGSPWSMYAAKLIALPTAGDDWLTNWLYCKDEYLTATPNLKATISTGAGNYGPIRIVLHYGVGVDSADDWYLHNLAKADFGDVRFIASDGVTELDYWIESYSSASTATVWIASYDDLNTGPSLIKLYFGNNSATSNSAATSLFYFIQNLLLAYKLDGTVNDSSGYARHGTKGGDAAYTYNAMYGQALHFAGAGYLTTPASAYLDPTKISIFFCLYAETLGAGYTALFGRNGSSSSRCQIGPAGANIYIEDLPIGGVNRALTGTYTFEAKKYYQIALTFDGDYIKMYVNGAAIATSPQYTGDLSFTAAQGWVFGALNYSGLVNPLEGVLDNILIFSEALTATDLQEMYSNTYGYRYPDVLANYTVYVRNYVNNGVYSFPGNTLSVLNNFESYQTNTDYFNRLKKAIASKYNSSFNVLYTTLTLGTTQDTTTGWYPPEYVATTIEMVIQTTASNFIGTQTGYFTHLNALGYTTVKVEVGNRITYATKLYRIDGVKPAMIGDTVMYYVCDLVEVQA